MVFCCAFISSAQVGVNTIYPLGVFHVDGAGDNTSATPTEVMQLNDFLIDSQGRIGVGLTTPTHRLHMLLSDSNMGFYERRTNTNGESIAQYFKVYNSSVNEYVKGAMFFERTGSAGRGAFHFNINGINDNSNVDINDKIISITSGGLGIRNSNPIYSLDIIGTGNNAFRSTRYGSVPYFDFRRAQGSEATPGNNGNGSVLSNMRFYAYNTSSFYQAAGIQVAVDGTTLSTTSMPGRIIFETTPSGSVTPLERLRISNNGNVGIGNIAGTRTLDVNGELRVRTVSAAGTPSAVSPRVWASDTNGNLSTITAAQIVSEGGALSTVSVTSPIAGNGTSGNPISLNDLGVNTAKLADNAVTTAKINNSNVTYAKIQNVSSARILGNPTGSATAPSEIGLGSGLAFDGSNLIAKQVFTIPLNTTDAIFSNTSGAELTSTRTGFNPTIVNSSGNVQMKLVLFLYSNASTTNLQFKGWNGSTDNYYFTTSDTWTYTNRGTDTFVVETDWKNITAGTIPLQLSFFTWVANNSANIKNSYLLVRSQ